MSTHAKAKDEDERPELPQFVVAQAEAVASSNAEDEELSRKKKAAGQSSTQGSSNKPTSDGASYDFALDTCRLRANTSVLGRRELRSFPSSSSHPLYSATNMDRSTSTKMDLIQGRTSQV